ncbi:hypothetical protein L210DRAFT_3647402 [Boletus edulis BED1]|uniref:F-box domain-containing protein n=1 Tax=Boletus edulis BED1 TaxID=1328754 RepID=A0AAD4BPW6_BOLED|nr:hypothetical protein L210DRAFT_3647402 [Boletus edulis BED1]
MSDSTTLSLCQLPPEVLHFTTSISQTSCDYAGTTSQVSRYLNGISHSRQVWTNAYRTAEFVHPPGPFLWQSACDLETTLVCGFRVDRNLRNGSGPAQTEKPALKMREIRCKNFYGGVNLVFGRFLLIGFRNEICCYDLNIEVLDSNRDSIIIYRSPGQQLGEFHCVSSFDVEGRPFACAVLLHLKGTAGRRRDLTPQFSIYLLHVGEQSGVTLDLLHQFVSLTMLTGSINLGPRVIVFQNDKGRPVVALDVHTRTEFLIPSIHALMEAAGITEFIPMRFSSTSISTSTHVVMGRSYFSGDGRRTFFQAFSLPPSNNQCPSTSLSPSHRGVISDIEVFDNALLHDAIVDSSTKDVLITIRVHTRAAGGLKCEHGILRLSTDGTITFQLLGSFHGSGRAFTFELAGHHGLISAVDYDLRASGNDDNETKVAEYPRVVRCSSYHDLEDYDPYSGRLCIARHISNLYPPVIEIVDLAI